MAGSEIERMDRQVARKSRWLIGLIGVGLIAVIAGFAGGSGSEGDAATNFGILAGVGVAFVGGGAVALWILRAGKAMGDEPGGAVRRDRMQIQRSRQLWVFPIVTALFLALAVEAAGHIFDGTARTIHYMQILIPVLYAWLSTAVAMGWDNYSRQNRKYLEDELTQVLRARAMSWAFIVLMVGVTATLGLGLWRPETGVIALPFVLSAAGATAAIRFVWLDREAGRDG